MDQESGKKSERCEPEGTSSKKRGYKSFLSTHNQKEPNVARIKNKDSPFGNLDDLEDAN